MISEMRKRKGQNDPVLPQYSSVMSQSQRHSAHRKNRRRNICKQTIRNCLACLLIIGLAGGAIIRFVPAERLEKHKTKLHHHRKKVVAYAKKHKHKVIQPLKNIAKIAKNRKFSLFKSRQVVTCPNGAKGLLNDDYCDCSDGRDEPLTSACSHILVQKNTFACSDGSGFVFSSRVGDGVKDCADGSDEGITSKARLRRTPGIHEIMDLNSV